MLLPSWLRKSGTTLALVLVAAVSFSQTVNWSRTYTRADPGGTLSNVVRRDAVGNIYMGGAWGNEDNSQIQIFVRKYTTDGVLVWTHIYDVADELEQISTMDVDGSGNVYVCGTTTSDWYGKRWMVYKVSAAGTLAWTRNPVLGSANDISVTSDGEAAVCGFANSKNNGADMYTVKYSTTGAVLWTGRSNGTKNANDTAVSVSHDAAGNTYVLGSCVATGDLKEMRTIKYGVDGSKAWQVSYLGPTGKIEPTKLIAWPAGGCYSVGRQWDGVTENSSDMVTTRLDADGSTMWRKLFNGSSKLSDVPQAMAIDNSGNCVVAGLTSHTETGNDVGVIKYSPTGNLLWSRRYFQGKTEMDSASDVKIGTNGNIFVVGHVFVPGATFGDFDMYGLVVKYDSFGTKQWALRYNEGASTEDFFWSVVLDDLNRPVVVGGTAPPGAAKAAVILKVH